MRQGSCLWCGKLKKGKRKNAGAKYYCSTRCKDLDIVHRPVMVGRKKKQTL